MRKKSTFDRIWILASVLLCLNLLCIGGVSRAFARYTTQYTAVSTARVAAWDTVVTGAPVTQTDIVAGLSDYTAGEYGTYGISSAAPDSNGYVTSGYRFRVQTGTATDAAGSLSVQISVSQDGTENWPEGLTAALYSVAGEAGSESYTFISQNTTGSFQSIKTVAPGTAFCGEYIVCFKATATAVAGAYQISIVAAMDQVD